MNAESINFKNLDIPSMTNVTLATRRGFLGKVFSAGALVLGAQLLPVEAV